MSSYKRGRKVKHRKKIYKKRKRNSALSVIITIVLVVVAVFVGYSVGLPVVNYFKDKDNETHVTEFEPEITTEQTQETQETTAVVVEEPEDVTSKSAVFYIASAVPDDMETLKAEIDIAKQSDANTFAVVLKQEGGTIHYKSSISSIQDSDIIVGTLTAKEISDEIISNGMKPVAIIDVLSDNLLPRVSSGTGVTFENGSTTWLDNKVSSGGKPWVSPFSEKTRLYISQVVDEVVNNGFSDVIAKDVEFPPFRNSDLKLVSSDFKAENRNTALTSIMNVITDKVKSLGGTTYLYVDGTKVIDGTEEVFVPSQLGDIKYIAEITKNTFKGEVITSASVKDLILEFKDLSAPNEILMRNKKADFTQDELDIISKTSTENDINSNFKS